MVQRLRPANTHTHAMRACSTPRAHRALVVDDGIEAAAAVVVGEACIDARATHGATVLRRVEGHRGVPRRHVRAGAGAALASAAVVCEIPRELEAAATTTTPATHTRSAATCGSCGCDGRGCHLAPRFKRMRTCRDERTTCLSTSLCRPSAVATRSVYTPR